jgi:hypothetical protein
MEKWIDHISNPYSINRFTEPFLSRPNCASGVRSPFHSLRSLKRTNLGIIAVTTFKRTKRGLNCKYLLPVQHHSLYRTFLVTLDAGERPVSKRSNKERKIEKKKS